jgi:hypothetical protein
VCSLAHGGWWCAEGANAPLAFPEFRAEEASTIRLCGILDLKVASCGTFFVSEFCWVVLNGECLFTSAAAATATS